MTLNVTSRTMENLIASCCSQLQEQDDVFGVVTSAMMKKLKNYLTIARSSLAQFAHVVDPRFRADIPIDVEAMQEFVVWLVSSEESSLMPASSKRS